MSDTKTRDLSTEIKRTQIGPYKIQAFWDSKNQEIVVTQSWWVSDLEGDVTQEWDIIKVYNKPFEFITSTLFA